MLLCDGTVLIIPARQYPGCALKKPRMMPFFKQKSEKCKKYQWRFIVFQSSQNFFITPGKALKCLIIKRKLSPLELVFLQDHTLKKFHCDAYV